MGKLINSIVDAISGLGETKSQPAMTQARFPHLDLVTGEKYFVDDVADAYFSNSFRACLLAKARPISTLPVDVFTRESGERKRDDAPAAVALSLLLRHRWNPTLTSAEGLRWALMTKDTKGNAFVRVQYDGMGVPVALWPLQGEPTVTFTATGEPVFDYSGDSRVPAGRYLNNEVIWIKSPVIDSDGYTGVSLAKLAARELGMSINLERFYEKLITNGSHFPQWIESDAELTDNDRTKLQQQLSDHRGLTSAGEVRLFDHGMKVRQSSLSIADMSLVEQETWILQQCCRTLSVPPQKVYDLSHATYSNVEQGALDFAKDSLTPECKALEQAFSDVLWNTGMKDSYVQFNMDGLLRGDYESRMNGYRTSVLGGWMTLNQVCEKEDLPRFEGGDFHMVSSAYSVIDPDTGEITQVSNGNAPDVGGSGEGVVQTTGNPNGRPKDVLGPVYADMCERVSQRFSDKGVSDQTRLFASRVLTPYADACAEIGEPYDMQSDIERLARDARH
jgi:HK97 family phage portal protein